MEKNVLALCDLEVDYVLKLSEYIGKKKNLPFDVHAFTDPEAFVAFAKDSRVDILLISEEAHYELRNMIGTLEIKEIRVLSGEVSGESFSGCRMIYKYQSAEKLLKEVMCLYAESDKKIFPGSAYSEDTKLIGVYSPVKRSLKTSFAMTLGQILSEKERVLYINLEEYSGFNNLMKTSYVTDMSDLMYYISLKKPNFIWKLASIVQSVGGLDYIPPALSPVDIKSISHDMWREFFEQLMLCGYGKVILDLGESVDGLYDLLRKCSVIYTPVRDDAVSYAKLEQYEALLKNMGYEDVLEKTRKLSFVYFKGLQRGLDRLVYSELGAYVRSLLKSAQP